MLLLGKQCETITRSFLRHHADFHLRSQALVTSLSSYHIIAVHCGTHANLWLTATFPFLWVLAASFDEAVRDQNLSLFLRHHRRLVAASSPTFICAHRRLRHHCRHTTSLSFIAALMPTFCLTATFPFLWDLATSFDEAVRDQNLSLFLRHHRRLVAASSPTFICAHRRLRLHCRLTTSLSFMAVQYATF
jgi:hypothetical protein